MSFSSRAREVSNEFGGVRIYRRFDAPSQGRLASSDAAARVREWVSAAPFAMRDLFDAIALRALSRHIDSPAAQRAAMIGGLEHAFARGELVAVAFKRHIPAPPTIERVPEPEPPPPPPSEEEQAQNAWIEIAVKTAKGEPAKGVAYRIRTPDGRYREGTLDGNGTARVEGIHEGECEVSFPEL